MKATAAAMHASANSASVAYLASRSMRAAPIAVPDHPTTRAVEVFPDPRMFVADNAVQGIDDDFAVHEHGDTITCPREGVQIVRHHHHREAERAPQVQHQVVEGSGRDGIEAITKETLDNS